MRFSHHHSRLLSEVEPEVKRNERSSFCLQNTAHSNSSIKGATVEKERKKKKKRSVPEEG